MVGRGLAGGFPEHLEGETSLGTVREVAEEVGSRPNGLSKVLPRSGPGGATLWVANLGIDGSDDGKNREGPGVFLAAGDGDEGLKSGGRYFSKGGGRQGDPGGREQTSS